MQNHINFLLIIQYEARNTKTLLDVIKEVGLEGNAEKLSISPCLVTRIQDNMII